MYRVLVVDDSAVFRAVLSEIINSDPAFEVVGVAIDPFDAREKIKKLKPDVVTLDIEMPKMNGVQFLRNLMRLNPLPVVMISTLTQHGADATLAALDLGAVDYFPKPNNQLTEHMSKYRQDVLDKLRLACSSNVKTRVMSSAQVFTLPIPQKPLGLGCEIIALGASTGGTEAVRRILETLPLTMPPIVVTQHIKAVFSRSFAERLDRICQLKVLELPEQKQLLKPGHVYIAPGDFHMKVVKKAGNYYSIRCDSDPVERHKPSVDVMFHSVAEAAGDKCLSVLLTGMGKDGARGMLAMRKQGALTVAQDQASSVVWGMPKAAIDLNAAQKVLALEKIAPFIVRSVYEQ